nr:MRB1-associated_protein/GeneDB:LmjF.33.2730 [Leishmania donovani]
MNGELNIGAGRVIFYRTIAKQNRNTLPLWTLQRHLYAYHPYVWFAIASASNAEAMEALAERLGMKLVQDATTSYKISIRRSSELLDGELNAQLQCTKMNRPWDRFLVTHYVRSQMPDLRFLVRARHPIKKRIVDAYLETDILRSTRDSVQSVLSPELGEVCYCCERVIRKWAMRTQAGVTLQLVETRRTPLIITKAGDEGERLEYEWIVVLPQKAERVDVAALSAELWDYGNLLARELEPGMEEFLSHTMTAAASY